MNPVFARVLDGEGRGREASEDECREGRSSRGVLWIHLNYSDETSATWLVEESGLDEVTAEALLAPDPRARSLVVGDGLMVILRGINVAEGADPEDMVALRVWLEKDRVISVRRRSIAAAQSVLQALDRGMGPADSGDLLQSIVDQLMDRISVTVQQLEDDVDDLEERVLSAESRELRTKISELRRKAIALRRHIAPQRETLGRLHTERVTWLSDLARARLRESADRVIRHVETLDFARERAAVTYEELSNRMAEQMNHTMYRLSIVAAIFLPLGLLTGLLGINVGGIPGTQSPWAFALVSVALVLIGIGEWLYFRSSRLL